MLGKYAFACELSAPQAQTLADEVAQAVTLHWPTLHAMGLEDWQVYSETVEQRLYGFQFFCVAPDTEAQPLLDWLRAHTTLLQGWQEAQHVYEFKLHPGDTYEGLTKQGIIIGVKDGQLDEYIRLHDEQPQIIHDLCYSNGFRKSSIFVAALHKPYLLQFQAFSGQEDPKLYEDATYQHWLAVTGACQEPLPGEKFWKAMDLLWLHQ